MVGTIILAILGSLVICLMIWAKDHMDDDE